MSTSKELLSLFNSENVEQFISDNKEAIKEYLQGKLPEPCNLGTLVEFLISKEGWYHLYDLAGTNIDPEFFQSEEYVNNKSLHAKEKELWFSVIEEKCRLSSNDLKTLRDLVDTVF